MQLRLITKIALVATLVLVTGMGGYAWLAISQMRSVLMEHEVANADQVSAMLVRTTHYQMLENDTPRVYQLIREAAGHPGIDRIRLISKSGRVIFSTNDDEVGLFIRKNAEGCNSCHAAGTPRVNAPSMHRSRLFTTEGGKEVLGLTQAIYNEPSCINASCHYHPASLKVLGVLDVVMSLETLQQHIAAYRTKLIGLTLLLVLTIWGTMAILAQRLVNQPVQQLVAHTRRIANGELDRQLPVERRDEWGELAQSVNDMSAKLLAARQEQEEWARMLELKVEERSWELQQIQRQLVRSEKLAALGELTAGIAHEINNPLAGILMFAHLVADDPRLDPGLKEELATIAEQTQRCAKIVRGLLDFSRESTPQKEPTSLVDCMERTLALVGNQATFHDIEVIRDYAPELPLLLADGQQLEQVFINLLLNASHAMSDGGHISVRIWCPPGDDELCIAIADTGCGIQPEHQDRIFDPFFTTRQSSGTGLGLAVSYGIIENHGGKIRVESQVGQGTTFTIRLPLGDIATSG